MVQPWVQEFTALLVDEATNNNVSRDVMKAVNLTIIIQPLTVRAPLVAALHSAGHQIKRELSELATRCREKSRVLIRTPRPHMLMTNTRLEIIITIKVQSCIPNNYFQNRKVVTAHAPSPLQPAQCPCVLHQKYCHICRCDEIQYCIVCYFQYIGYSVAILFSVFD